MPVREILKMGHPILRLVAEPVADPTAPEIRQVVQDMIDTMEAIQACGIAAPQIRVSKRVFTYRLTPDRIPPGSPLKPIGWTTMVNPVITPETDRKVMVWERCLSLPGLHGKVPRYPKITIRYQTLEGKPASQHVDGWLAPVFQHEVDHLDGILYPMRMTDLSLLAFNTAPGPLAMDAERNPQLDLLYRRMAEAWPEHDEWTRATAAAG